ncbi:MAG: hypothetical protein Q9P44_04260 [Anaerolineae bacterium]|nr:hypothetical protein [Anaerolineae bacterium]
MAIYVADAYNYCNYDDSHLRSTIDSFNGVVEIKDTVNDGG